MKKDKVSLGMEPVFNDTGGGKGGGSKVLAIVLIVLAAVITVVAGGLFVWNSGLLFQTGVVPPPATEPTKEFTFEKGTKVSGLDIAGKTVSEAKAYLEENKLSLVKPITISVTAEDEEATITQDDFAYTFNIDETVDRVKADADNMLSTASCEYAVETEISDESVATIASLFCEEFNCEPTGAYVSKFHPFANNRFDIAEAEDGFTVNEDKLVEQLKEALASGRESVSVVCETEPVHSDITADYVKKHLVKLASYETVSTNTDNATNNMKVALDSCSGSVIAPGGVWSFNECTGDSNLESNGYKTAHVISEGRLIDGIGGGICQASSTIYNAAIRSNMSTVERYCHKWASLYVPTGLDATIDYPNLDLKLCNTSDFQMFLECKVSGSTLHATFWGFRNGDYDEIRTRNEKGEVGEKSYNVNAWRVYYKDGKKIGEEELFSSTYDLENGVRFYTADDDSGAVYSGPGPMPKEPETTAPPETTEAAKATEAEETAETTQTATKAAAASAALR